MGVAARTVPARRVGVLLLNLGTPDSPTTRDVRRYLREFLSDPRVIDTHPIIRKLLLELVILPTRPRRSAAAYRQVWTPRGSPLLVESEALAKGVADALGSDFHVALGMRYGSPSIPAALEVLLSRSPEQLVVLPLFPQYADASTGSALARVAEVLEESAVTNVSSVPAFYDDPGFIAAWAAVAREPLAAFRPDHVLFSYHGLPERQIRRTDESGRHCFERSDCCEKIVSANRNCYRAHCQATSVSLAAVLELEESQWSMSFQSRLDGAWIRPFTDEWVEELARDGHRRLAVLCPAFVADCLETLEEVGIRLREQWLALGGEDLLLVPSLNAHPRWIEAVANLVRVHSLDAS